MMYLTYKWIFLDEPFQNICEDKEGEDNMLFQKPFWMTSNLFIYFKFSNLIEDFIHFCCCM